MVLKLPKIVIPADSLPDPTQYDSFFRLRIVSEDRNRFSAWSVIIDVPNE